MRPNWSLIFGENKTWSEEERRREEDEEKKKRKKRRNVWNLLSFVWKNQTINPFFFYEFGSKRTILGILVVFGKFRLDFSCFGLVLWLILGYMETKYGFPKFF